MKNCIIAVDLGTTNIKAVLFDSSLATVAERSKNVDYLRDGEKVEFDAERYFDDVSGLIISCCEAGFGGGGSYPVMEIVLTGQAESLVVLDKDYRPLRRAISWMDERSAEEVAELKAVFSPDICYYTTGQPEIIPTWPVTKMLWIKKHEPAVFSEAHKYLLLKDYIQYRLCGVLAGDYSIYNFSHYFNIVTKEYWRDILDYVGIPTEKLPKPVPSGTVLGAITPEFSRLSGISGDCRVNVGTLDHFAGMIGCGNIAEGAVSESTGTVLALAAMLNEPLFSEARMQLHCGPFPGTYVLLPVCESGGFSLEWYKKRFMRDVGYSEIDAVCSKRSRPDNMLFIPYISGSNAPDFNAEASGVFFGFKAKNDEFDFAGAVMEGVALMLERNITYMREAGVKIERLISTGGGAKSAYWNQLKADVTGQEISVPVNKETACLGAGVIGCVSEGLFSGYPEAVAACVKTERVYAPRLHEAYLEKIARWRQLYESLQPVYHAQATGGSDA